MADWKHSFCPLQKPIAPWNEIKFNWKLIMDDYCIVCVGLYGSLSSNKGLRVVSVLYCRIPPQVLAVRAIPCVLSCWQWKAGTKTTFKITDRRNACGTDMWWVQGVKRRGGLRGKEDKSLVFYLLNVSGFHKKKPLHVLEADDHDSVVRQNN